MKHVFLAACYCLTALFAGAQFDDKFYYPNNELKSLEGFTYEEVVLPVETDSIHGLFFKPSGKPKATIFYCHGAGGNVTSYKEYFRPLIDDGFQVFAIDFRGYGKSTGKPTHVNIAADGQVVFNYLLNRADVKKTPLIVYGVSMGTCIAAKLAHDNPKTVSALVLDGTIASFTDIAAATSSPEQQVMIRQYVTSPYAPKEDVRTLEGMPKLFIASRGDQGVPFAQTELVFANAPEPKTLLEYEGDHLEIMEKDPQAALRAVNSLLRP